jgi:Na+/H+-translocating membrane pyrophosphatase
MREISDAIKAGAEAYLGHQYAKKHTEAGRLGGRESQVHAATVIGDTLGDPLKDTARPFLHLVKVLNTRTLTLSLLFIYVLLR